MWSVLQLKAHAMLQFAKGVVSNRSLTGRKLRLKLASSVVPLSTLAENQSGAKTCHRVLFVAKTKLFCKDHGPFMQTLL